MPHVATEPATAARAAAAELLDRRAEELYRLLLPLSRPLAAGVFSGLLLAAENLREGAIVGQDAVNVNLVIDATLGRPVAVIYLQAHRGHPPLREDSPPLERGHLGELLGALREGELIGDEFRAVLAALSPELGRWLACAADQALATATETERALWAGRPPLEVAVELLVIALRRLAREISHEVAAR